MVSPVAINPSPKGHGSLAYRSETRWLGFLHIMPKLVLYIMSKLVLNIMSKLVLHIMSKLYDYVPFSSFVKGLS